MHFIVSVACGYIDGDHNKDNKNRSMIIHPDRELESHDQYINWINGLKVKWVNELRADKNSDEYIELTKEIKNTLENIRNNANNKNKIPNFSDNFIDYFKEALQNIIPTEFNAGRGRRRRRIPIIPWDRRYANLLIEKVNKYNIDVYLVNTGWVNGPYGIGNRFDIPVTRAIISAIQSNELVNSKTEKIKSINLEVPLEVSGVDSVLLNPIKNWKDPSSYDKYAQNLIKKFTDNFSKFKVSEDVVASGPQAN